MGHRPFPLPREPWLLFQSWRDLLFAHWPVPVWQLRALVPESLEIDAHEGQAWVGLTPFRMVGLRPRGLPPVPRLSSFPEMNLRTYVRHRGRTGIHFFSLDAASRLAVLGARLSYRLPYYYAAMAAIRKDGWIAYRSHRLGTPGAELVARYRATGPVFRPAPGSLERFLVERYALFAVPSRGTVLRAEVHHLPWELQPAEAELTRNTVPAAHGIELPPDPPLLHFAARQDTLVWPRHRVE